MIPSLFSEQGRQAVALVLLAIFGSLMLSQLPHERTAWSRFEADYLVDKQAKVEARAASLYREGLRIVCGEAVEFFDVDWITHELCTLGKYAEAKYLLKQTLASIRATKGEDSLFVALAQTSLAQVYLGQENFFEAERAVKDALRIEIKNSDKLAALDSERWLAWQYFERGRYKDAIPYFRQALERCENDSTLRLGISDCYYYTDDLGKAESGYRQVLASIKDNDSAEIKIRCLLGLGLIEVGRFEFKSAEALLSDSLSLSKRSFGSNHPTSARCLMALAGLYKTKGHLDRAERLYRQALAVSVATTGEQSSQSADSAANLGSVLFDQDRFLEAELITRKALEIDRSVIGPRHPATLKVASNLATILSNRNKVIEAESLHRQVLALRLILNQGSNHPDVATSMNNLACLCEDVGRLDEAEALYGEALRIRTLIFGEMSPQTAICLNNLGHLKYNQGEVEEAIALYDNAWRISKSALGEDHHRTISYRTNLIRPLLDLGRIKDAEKFALEASDTSRRTSGERSCQYACCLRALSAVRKAQGKQKEADTLSEKAEEIQTSLSGPRLSWTRDLIGKIAQLHPWWASSSLIKH
ncbi:MAG: tetratricopeptide repeat protein [Cyanobacteria bacterium HKST-UBA02]|nr:tetratricopeptide repeat protein [Cyanobacteria bacterium HKST-UBA02]